MTNGYDYRIIDLFIYLCDISTAEMAVTMMNYSSIINDEIIIICNSFDGNNDNFIDDDDVHKSYEKVQLHQWKQ